MNSIFLPKNIKGAGDIIHAVARPIAKAIDTVARTNIQNCGGCKKRREALNAKFPFKQH